MRSWICIASILLLTLGLFGQEIEVQTRDYSAEEGIFAPYVSRIRIGQRGPVVVLTWEDSEDSSGKALVYRLSEPITKESFSRSVVVGSLDSSLGKFEDSPEKPGEYYYAVLLINPSGNPYEIFVPFKNTTAVGIEPDIPLKSAQTASEETKISQVNSISARVDADAVVIRLSVPQVGHRLILYRGAEPILDSAGILGASIVTIFEDSIQELKDYPVPGIDYYYAIIDEVQLRGGSVKLSPGENTTAQPVKIAAGTYRIGLPDVSPLSRTLPLPYLVLSSSIGSGERMGSPIRIGESALIGTETEKAIDRILGGLAVQEEFLPLPTVLDQELKDPVSGEDYTLIMIVRETIQTQKWKEAIAQIEKFLSLHRSPETEVRSRFYLGQAYAMTGMYRNALFSFLIAQDDYYAQAKPWIEFCLKALRK